MEKILKIIAEELNLKINQVRSTIDLLDDGNTVPFLARYRKEMTGSLDEENIRQIRDRATYLRNLEQRKETILQSIDEQKKLTPELKKDIESATTLQILEDLYLPYRPKKRTRATIAKERGLEDLANKILSGELNKENRKEIICSFINPDKEVNSEEEALNGSMDIIAEVISENAETRKRIRNYIRAKGLIASSLVDDNREESDFQVYENFEQPIIKIPPHRIMAINRGEKLKSLKVKIETNSVDCTDIICRQFAVTTSDICNNIISEASEDAYRRLIFPAVSRELKNELTEKAEQHAISVFATNLRNLLLQPPMPEVRIMGIDPGFRSGCKVAVIDSTGQYLEGETIYPHPPQKEIFKAKSILRGMIDEFEVDVIAIGNGTASRETEHLVSEMIEEIKDEKNELSYIIVSEAGASVYSASKVAKDEFPELEASMRGNISIARRLLDPLSELLKIEPHHIGVGQYQHDVNQKALNGSLTEVVESAVNHVGVDLNTASAFLLRYISGLTLRSARNIINYRNKNGKFHDRMELKKVTGIGDMAFEQAAGFLRIRGGDNPLDNTSIHPESYPATEALLKKFHLDLKNIEKSQIEQFVKNLDIDGTADELGIGRPTFEDIIENLKKPGRDPRLDLPKPILKENVLSIDDLKEGMQLQGTVRNVVDFGAFVDIGLKNDGLVHISELSDRFVKNPHEFVSVGQVVSVTVKSIDKKRGRISLSMKKVKDRNI